MKYWKKSAKRDSAFFVWGGHSCPPPLALMFSTQELPLGREPLRSLAPPDSRERGCPHAAGGTSPLNSSLTKVAGKPIANFLGTPYCQRGDVYPSILTESRPAGLVMAVTDF